MARPFRRTKRSSRAIQMTEVPTATIPPDKTKASSRTFLLLQTLLIVAAVLWIYWPSLHGDWLWDDNLYLTENPLLNDPARLWKIWFVPGSLVEYYPITESFQ